MRQAGYPATRWPSATTARVIDPSSGASVIPRRFHSDVRSRAGDRATYIAGDVTGTFEAGPETLVIDGNVTGSGAVLAAGSVVVTGSIAGKVHAGCRGNRAATIRARRLQTDRLAVADASGLDSAAQQQGAGGSPAGGMVSVSVAGSGQRLQVKGLSALPPAPSSPGQTDDAAHPSHAWSAAGRLAAFTGGYAILAGLALTLAPRATFGLLFNAAEVTTGWIRVGGVLFTLIGMQYLGTAVLEHRGHGAGSFYQASVWSRLYLVAGFVLLVATGQSPWGVALLAAINAAGALSMLRVLRSRRALPAPS